MKSLSVIIFVLFVIAYSDASENIIPSNFPQVGQFPFMAAIDACGTLCGGFIISDTHIATSANFLFGKTIACVTVRVGTVDISPGSTGGQNITANNFTTHPSYSNATKKFDSAVITLSRAITIDGTTTQIATVANNSATQLPANNTATYIAGWGITVNGSSSFPGFLSWGTVPYINLTTCNNSYGGNLTTGNQICAGNGTNGWCTGDEGGPLFTAVNASTTPATGVVIIGIASFTNSCGFAGVPQVYSDIPGYAGAFFQTVIGSSGSISASLSVNASSVAPSSVAPSSVVVASSSGAIASSSGAVAPSSVVVASSSGAVAASSSGAVVASSSGAVAASSSKNAVASSSGVVAASSSKNNVASSSGVAPSSVVAASSSGPAVVSSGAGSKTSSKSQSNTPSLSKPIAVSSGFVNATSATVSKAATSAAKSKAAKTKTGLAAITCRQDCQKTFRSCKRTTRRIRTCKKAKKVCVSGCGIVNPNRRA